MSEDIRTVPGIIVAQRPSEQSARIMSTGIEVWQVYRVYKAVNQSWDELRAAFDWLTEAQLKAALEYARLHREAMEQRLQAEEAVDLEQLWKDYPSTAPKHH